MALLDVSSTFREVEFIIEKVVKKLSRQQEYFVDRLSRHVFLVRSSSSKMISPDSPAYIFRSHRLHIEVSVQTVASRLSRLGRNPLSC